MIRLHCTGVQCSGIMQLWLLLWHYLGVGQVGWVSFFFFLSFFFFFFGRPAQMQTSRREEGCRRNRERGRLQGGSIGKMRSIEEMEGLL